ncbi:MAG: hypothetical protein PHI63_02330 [Patescibacteria group bacterium]|nr:hypothetical protein [Patescibacteria group bacterium]
MDQTEVVGVPLDKGVLGALVFIVKFYFTNPSQIPPGIPQKDRLENSELDAYHAAMMGLLGQEALGTLGRLREGRVDTGICVIQNLPAVQVGVLRRGFANNELRLIDAHWFRLEPREPGRKPKFVVNLTFAQVRHADVVLPELPRKTVEALRALANTTWAFCHVWDNSPIPVATVNCVGRQPDAKPTNAIVVRQRIVCAVPVAQRLEEKDE